MIKELTRYTRKALRKDPSARYWYQWAGDWLSELDQEHGLAPGTAAGVCAALSPMNSWEIQIRDVPRIIRGAMPLLAKGSLPHPAIIGPGFYSNKNKAARILMGESPAVVLSGLKVRSFWANLTGDWHEVTIDRHALAIVGWSRSLTPAAYNRLSFVYRAAAENCGLAPAECQAVTWSLWRKEKAA